MNLFLILFILLVCLIFYLNYKRNQKYESLPPGPDNLIPFIGGLLKLGTNPAKYLYELQKTYGNYFTYDFGNFKAVILNDIEIIKESSVIDEFSGRIRNAGFKYWFDGEKDQKGVIHSDGETWHENRKFALRNLRGFRVDAKPLGDSLDKIELEELIENFKKLEGTPFILEKQFTRSLLNSIWVIIAGHRYEENDPKLTKLWFYLTKNIRVLILVFIFPWVFSLVDYLPSFCTKWAQDFIDGFRAIKNLMREHVEEHKKTFQENNPRDFVDLYLDKIRNEKNPNSIFYGENGEKNLVTLIQDIFIGGSEGTNTILNWALLILAVNPEIQEKLHKEIEQVVGNSRLPKLADRSMCPYTNAVIYEILRYTVITPFMFHRITNDIKFRGYLLPKDTVVAVNFWSYHRDSYWGDPDNFRPERFLSSDGKIFIGHDNYFQPFGSGRRTCLGEFLARDHTFLYITSLFQRFEIKPDPKLKEIPKKVESKMGTMHIPIPFPIITIDRYQ